MTKKIKSAKHVQQYSASFQCPIWLVADLAKSPLADQTFPIILNILSPANYREFKRILMPNGFVIKVVPGPNYLRELREMLTEKTEHRNDETMELFKQHFDLIDVLRLQDTTELHQTALHDLVYMTPLSWSSDQAQIEQFCKQNTATITIDLEILIGTSPSDKNFIGGNA